MTMEGTIEVKEIYLWIQIEKERLEKELGKLRSNGHGESGSAKLIRDRQNALSWLEKKVKEITF